MQGVVNDLTGAVRKKRKAPAAEGSEGLTTEGVNGKRKAEDSDEISTPTEKKLKLDDSAS